MIDSQEVRDGLREIVDPCSAATGSNLNIVEMGLVKSVVISGETVRVKMRLTTPACHMVPYFITEVQSTVGSLPDVSSVEVETDDGCEWTEELMSGAAKRRRRETLEEYETRYGDARE